MNTLTVLYLGGFLFGIGFLHLREKISQIDGKIFLTTHIFLQEKIGATLFQRLWFLGRTPFVLFWILVLIALIWKLGLLGGVIYSLAAALERGVKSLVGRPRPFEDIPKGVEMCQPQAPTDPSFPSGDSLRVWFLALLIPVFWGAPLPVYLLSIGIAFAVTLGRIAMGVHYPLDTVSGAGLGLLSAGMTILAWQAVGGI